MVLVPQTQLCFGLFAPPSHPTGTIFSGINSQYCKGKEDICPKCTAPGCWGCDGLKPLLTRLEVARARVSVGPGSALGDLGPFAQTAGQVRVTLSSWHGPALPVPNDSVPDVPATTSGATDITLGEERVCLLSCAVEYCWITLVCYSKDP